jgi:hypothetical protein
MIARSRPTLGDVSGEVARSSDTFPARHEAIAEGERAFEALLEDGLNI